VANTHDWALFFTDRGRVFSSKVHAVPDASRQAKGMPIINLEGVQVEAGERVLAVITLPDFEPGHNLVMATVAGIVKKTPIERFERVRSTGIRALTVGADDALAWVAVSSGSDDIILATAQGRIARFHEREVRPMGRDAAGVIGIRLARKGDRVVGMGVVQPGNDILVLTETGYGKRTAVDEFPVQGRGGQGVIAIQTSGRNGRMVGAIQARDEDEIMLISSGGTLVRTPVADISQQGRNTQGVRLIRIGEDERLVGLDRIVPGTDDDDGEPAA